MACIKINGPGRSVGYLCTIEPPVVPDPGCSNAANHEPFPTGYIAASDYAEKLMETHTQRECPGCGKFHIWTPKEGA